MPGSVLPPDIREKMKQHPALGIGGGAQENTVTSRQRDVAMNPDAPLREVSSADKAETVTEEPSTEIECPNSNCEEKVESSWNFCPRCSRELMGDGAEERLGIKFTEDDLSDYLFKGYITREIKVVGKHAATMKSSQPKDLDAIDTYIMNGDWAKGEDGEDRKVSDFFMRQMNAMCQTASCVVKINGESIGDTLEKRIDWMMERGSSFVDILSQKSNMFNQALSEYLKKEDTILGS